MASSLLLWLLFATYPDFQANWVMDAPIDPIVIETPAFVPGRLNDAQLAKQVEYYKQTSDPAMRSRIVFDLAKSGNVHIFEALEKLLAGEKTPSVRADILTAMANVPVIAAGAGQSVDPKSYVAITWKPACGAEVAASAKSAYLPEKLAAQRVLAIGKPVPAAEKRAWVSPLKSAGEAELIAIVEKNDCTKDIAALNEMRRNPSPAFADVLAKACLSDRTDIHHVEACRALAAQKKLPDSAVKALVSVAGEKIRVRNNARCYDNDAVRAAALMALKMHKAERAAGEAYQKLLKKFRTSSDADFCPVLLNEYVRQITSPKPVPPRALPAGPVNLTIQSL